MRNDSVQLDLTGCKYYLEMQERIRKAFGFPQSYGANWHAFWDFLNTECPSNRVVVIGAETLPKELQDSLKMMRHYLEDFRKNWTDSANPFSYAFLPADSSKN